MSEVNRNEAATRRRQLADLASAKGREPADRWARMAGALKQDLAARFDPVAQEVTLHYYARDAFLYARSKALWHAYKAYRDIMNSEVLRGRFLQLCSDRGCDLRKGDDPAYAILRFWVGCDHVDADMFATFLRYAYLSGMTRQEFRNWTDDKLLSHVLYAGIHDSFKEEFPDEFDRYLGELDDVKQRILPPGFG